MGIGGIDYDDAHEHDRWCGPLIVLASICGVGQDWIVAETRGNETFMERAMQADSAYRIGQGFDVHAFAEGRALIVGGVRIAHPRGLAGHSDADVLAHAIADALLGAAGLGDIGHHFPDSDARWKDADSLKLLAHVAGLLAERGWGVVNVDATIVAQTPKMAPHLPAMREKLAGAMGIEAGRVNLKATTTERLGFAGREEGIAAQATAMIAAP
jgi:2-C-methyl-D-erythritol 2,4-cyclodiphosphate synthase